MQDLEERKAHNILRRFAEQNSIAAIFRGVDPEDNSRKYYIFPSKKSYSSQLEDSISNTEIKISNETKHRCSLQAWPVSVSESSQYGFLEEPIYMKSI
ncbi:hypothetical protein GF336_00970 [Candidatus Woesearchaeota archaeon]|nr:hypothetical protein [Candidatus Woesearchaeota archaeon]